jgi:hypothetical protein
MQAQDSDEDREDYQKYQLMTSVSMPVFDQRENAVGIEMLCYL